MQSLTGKYYCRTIIATDLVKFQDHKFTDENLIDSFLFEEALEKIKKNQYNTTGVFCKDTDNIVAFFVLHLEDVKTQKLTEDIKKDLTYEQINEIEKFEEDSLRSRVRLAYLGVKSEEKCKGIGSYIIDKVSRVARRLSTDEVFVEALSTAYTFYEKQGFERLRLDVEMNAFITVEMVKHITPEDNII